MTSYSIHVEELTSLKTAIETFNAFVNAVKDSYSEPEYLSIKPTLQARASDLKKRIEYTPLSLVQDGGLQFNSDYTAVEKHLLLFEVVSLLAPFILLSIRMETSSWLTMLI